MKRINSLGLLLFSLSTALAAAPPTVREAKDKTLLLFEDQSTKILALQKIAEGDITKFKREHPNYGSSAAESTRLKQLESALELRKKETQRQENLTTVAREMNRRARLDDRTELMKFKADCEKTLSELRGKKNKTPDEQKQLDRTEQEYQWLKQVLNYLGRDPNPPAPPGPAKSKPSKSPSLK